MGPNIQPQHLRVGPGVGLSTMQCQRMPGTPFVPAPAPSAGLRDPWCTHTCNRLACTTRMGLLPHAYRHFAPLSAPGRPSRVGTRLWPAHRASRVFVVHPRPASRPPRAATIQLVLRPLLHAAARSLHPDATQQWEAHPFYGRLWADALANLQLAPAVPVATLATAVQTLQDAYAREGRQLSAFEAALPVLAALVEGLPAGTLAHLNWVLPRVTDTNGYVPASAQEALLENYRTHRSFLKRVYAPALSHLYLHRSRRPLPVPFPRVHPAAVTAAAAAVTTAPAAPAAPVAPAAPARVLAQVLSLATRPAPRPPRPVTPKRLALSHLPPRRPAAPLACKADNSAQHLRAWMLSTPRPACVSLARCSVRRPPLLKAHCGKQCILR